MAQGELKWQKCFPTRRRLRRTASPDQQAPCPRTVLGGAHLGASLRSKIRHEEAHPRSMLAVPTILIWRSSSAVSDFRWDGCLERVLRIILTMWRREQPVGGAMAQGSQHVKMQQSIARSNQDNTAICHITY
ncbi:uncharacterized protein [Lolium perenne]|uniref:uncharacterized protein n=1 Tax=Lolium perenne TaxID=4522 RepID=UPI0021F6575A|nr:uncharacterized protein LOC127307711 isoform X2 [Lolium perenne]